LHMGVYVKEKNSIFTKTPKKITPLLVINPCKASMLDLLSKSDRRVLRQ
jgi:hypothetical protein